MALTRDFKMTVVARVERDPAFAKALLDEAVTLFLSGEPETARLVLRDIVNATLGFERLAKVTAMPSKSLHRMLSPKGNPSMDNLAVIFDAVRKRLKGELKAHTVDRPQSLAPASSNPRKATFGRRSARDQYFG
jgi:DNA-binding phage protein